MSHAKNQSSLDSTKTKNISLMPNGKAAAAAPKVSDDSNVELNDMGASNDATPERDIMHLARLGDIKGIESLYESGRFDASYCDEEGITPLHVRFLQRNLKEFRLTYHTVGSNQQSIRNMPIPHKSWCRCKQEGGRVRSDTSHVGGPKMSLLYCTFTT